MSILQDFENKIPGACGMSDIYLVDSSDALVYPTTALSSLSEDEISGLEVIKLNTVSNSK